jgi:hypothetical protein
VTSPDSGPGHQPRPFSVRSRRWPRPGSSSHVGQPARARANPAPGGPSCVHEGRSVGRAPRSVQHAGVGGIERRATVDECQDVVERQVARRMRRMLETIARVYVAVLADVAGDHPLGQASPSCIRMDVVVGTDARAARMLAAASSRSARDHTADRLELHWAPRPRPRCGWAAHRASRPRPPCPRAGSGWTRASSWTSSRP